MRLVPIFRTDKAAYNKSIMDKGGEGTMLKDITSPYIQEGRPKSMYKLKRVEEVDAFVTGGNPGKEDAGWKLLIGDIEFSAYTERGVLHPVAYCANITLDERIEATVCGKCGAKLNVRHDNVDGKRVVLGTNCTATCGESPPPALNPSWLNRVAEIVGQEWTARVYRLKHANVGRWRDKGVDAKKPEECTISLESIQRRFLRAAATHALEGE